MMVTLTPGGRSTRSGTSLLVVESLPSSALVFWPQASTRPLDVRARAKEPPALMAVTFVPAGSWTRTGTWLSVVVSLPSCP